MTVFALAVAGPGPGAAFDGERLDNWGLECSPEQVWLGWEKYREEGLGFVRHVEELHIFLESHPGTQRFVLHRLATGPHVYHHESLTPKEAERRILENYAP